MKMKNYILLSLLTLMFVGCSKGEDMSSGPRSYKDIVYSVDMEIAESGSPYVVKGEYTDDRGNTVTVDNNTPWRIKLSNVPYGVPASFKGYVYCANTKKIVGTASMLVTAAGSERVIYSTKQEYDLYNSAGYTGESIKEATAFNFLEQ